VRPNADRRTGIRRNELPVTRAARQRQNAFAVGLLLSLLFHLVILVLALQQLSPVYNLPEEASPPMEAQIVQMEEPPPPPEVVPKYTPPKEVVTPPPVVVPPPKPESPKPQPPQPTPAPPPPPAPTPPVAVARPLPAPQEAPKPLPTTTPKPAPRPTPAPPAITAPPAPTAPPVAKATPAPPTALNLKIHKPKEEAPASVPSLPFAPSPSPPATAESGGTPRTSAPAGEPELGGSRLRGLSPYPPGTFPSGGGGIRGSLVGCANAEAVRLSPEERAKCNARFGVEIGGAPALDPIPAAKRAAFDRAAERDSASQRYRDSAAAGRGQNSPNATLSGRNSGETPTGPASVIPTSPP
jgi:hypothetical protein